MIKEFNTYLGAIDSDFWKGLILEFGILRSYKKGEDFLTEGEVGKYLGLIKSGSVKYLTYTTEYDERIVGLETVGGFAASWPFCLHDLPSVVTITANSDLEIYCLSVAKIKELAQNNLQIERQISQATEQIFYTAYERLIGFYIQSPKERYQELLRNCPKIFEVFDLKDIASFLNITPVHLSRLRKNLEERVSGT